MVVVAIIALLASIAVPNFLRARKRSQATRMLEDLRIIDSAIDQYAIGAFQIFEPGSNLTILDAMHFFVFGVRNVYHAFFINC